MSNLNHATEVRSFMELMKNMGDKSPYNVAEELKIKNGIRVSAALKALGYMNNPVKNKWAWAGPDQISQADAEKVAKMAYERGVNSERTKKRSAKTPGGEAFLLAFFRICEKNKVPFSESFYLDIKAICEK